MALNVGTGAEVQRLLASVVIGGTLLSGGVGTVLGHRSGGSLLRVQLGAKPNVAAAKPDELLHPARVRPFSISGDTRPALVAAGTLRIARSSVRGAAAPREGRRGRVATELAYKHLGIKFPRANEQPTLGI